MCLSSSRSLQRVLAGAMTFLYLIFLLSACTTNTQTVQSQPHPSLSSQMDAYLLSLVKAHQFRGAVLIASSGKVLLSKGYDMANTDLSLANTPTTMFGLGSVTKEFTAMAILMLQERGKLHIHDPICTYLSPCPPSWQQITIYHLLTHSSGIPNHSDPSGINLVQLEKEPLDFKPGTQFNYSNSGYVVLALIIEKVSGEAYGTFLQQNIFAPLQMTHTGYDFTQPQLPNLASGYYSWGANRTIQGSPWSLAPMVCIRPSKTSTAGIKPCSHTPRPWSPGKHWKKCSPTLSPSVLARKPQTVHLSPHTTCRPSTLQPMHLPSL
jgi:CubicO group peptidase (beta-lactamase class C family)